jgi:hypothetical protein
LISERRGPDAASVEDIVGSSSWARGASPSEASG